MSLWLKWNVPVFQQEDNFLFAVCLVWWPKLKILVAMHSCAIYECGEDSSDGISKIYWLYLGYLINPIKITKVQYIVSGLWIFISEYEVCKMKYTPLWKIQTKFVNYWLCKWNLSKCFIWNQAATYKIKCKKYNFYEFV